ncbi:uncharacterized protein LOC107820545 [Nicotiana tabacum]|uniref:Uncharacterized protein LOC107820545 n=1 Tax=Nicotiana tabacum TaxID=4097 RepID=A0AC58SRW4_TOBAC
MVNISDSIGAGSADRNQNFGETRKPGRGRFVSIQEASKYINDGRPFWQHIFSSSTGCSDSQYFEKLYNYYTTEQAWHLCDPDAERVKAEKPNPTISLKACELLEINPEDAVPVGDDRRNDIWGARDAGCDAWLWGSDVNFFKEVAQRIGVDV